MQRWWPFVLLLLVGASRWAVSAARPDAESTLTSETFGCAWATLLALAFLLPKRQRASLPLKPSRGAMLRWFFSGAMLFGGPAIGILLPGRDLDSSALTIALALTPIIIAIASSALGTESSEGIAGRIWPSLAAVAVPLAAVNTVRASQAAVLSGDPAQALADARAAVRLEPDAASPRIQLALVLELEGDIPSALAAAQAAASNEPSNWSTWLIVSRLEAEDGHPTASVAAYLRSRSLNPQSPLFRQ